MSNRLLVAVPICLLSVIALLGPSRIRPLQSGPPLRRSGAHRKADRRCARNISSSCSRSALYYVKSGDAEKLTWAEEELKDYHMMSHYPYIKDLFVPPPTLQGTVNILEANNLFERALKYKDTGYGTDYIENQHRAEILLQELITKYPQSDKISERRLRPRRRL